MLGNVRCFFGFFIFKWLKGRKKIFRSGTKSVSQAPILGVDTESPTRETRKVVVSFPRRQKGTGSLKDAYSRPTEQAKSGNLKRTIL